MAGISSKKIVAAVATNAAADKLLFEDKQTQVNAILGEPDKENTPSAGGGTPVNQKDFYWDQIVLVLISAMLGLSFLDISIEFFRGSEVQCFFDIDNFSISKGNYINSYCYGSLPNAQYYLVFVLISALVVIAPHYLWSAYFAAQFDFFFDLIKNLDRLRDTHTGEYNPQNFERVKKLEEKFRKPRIFLFYILKLVLQFVFCIIALGVNIWFFEVDDFSVKFNCPRNCEFDDDGNLNCTAPDQYWPLDERFHCVYNSFRLLDFLHKAMFALLGMIICVLSIGFFWSCLGRHTNELGAKRIAEFCFNSCLQPDAFSFTPWTALLTCKRQRQKSHTNTKASCRNCLSSMYSWFRRIPHYFNPRITNDLDFLLMRLFKADSGHGHVFKDIQIARYLYTQNSDDHKRLYLLNKIQSDFLDEQITKRHEQKDGDHESSRITSPDDNWKRMGDIRKHFFDSGFSAVGNNPELQVYTNFETRVGAKWETNPSIRGALYGFLHFAPNNTLAMDISFGTSTGYSLVLARAFYDVATVHFNRFYKNPRRVCKVDKFQANYQTITFQEDIFSQTAQSITESEKLINDLFSHKDDGGLDLILIGPLRSISMSDTTTTLIEKMYFKRYFTRGAILLAIRPLKIGSHNRTADYWMYRPPKGLFRNITRTKVLPELKAAHISIIRVPMETSAGVQYSTGIEVKCNDVKCVFEFRLFEFIGDRFAPSSSAHSSVSGSISSISSDNATTYV